MEYSHDTREHFGGDLLVDSIVVVIIERLTRPKDMVSQSHNLILILLALVKTLLGTIVQSLLVLCGGMT